jgi:3-hydroxybutyryl-CoA dehydratase
LTLSVGDKLPELRRTVSQSEIRAYAEASGDFNPLHIDPKFAATTHFGGTIVHGMYQLAVISQLLTASFGEQWLASGRLKVRFKAPAHPDVELVASGEVSRLDEQSLMTGVRLSADEDLVVSGEASLSR